MAHYVAMIIYTFIRKIIFGWSLMMLIAHIIVDICWPFALIHQSQTRLLTLRGDFLYFYHLRLCFYHLTWWTDQRSSKIKDKTNNHQGVMWWNEINIIFLTFIIRLLSSLSNESYFLISRVPHKFWFNSAVDLC